ncbi:hypothetical protein MMC18_002058 [Xylographa bjoerkii]|nr:hypothetical protein [Xylographa bjoerkii]
MSSAPDPSLWQSSPSSTTTSASSNTSSPSTPSPQFGNIRTAVGVQGTIPSHKALSAAGDDINATRSYEGDAPTNVVDDDHTALVEYLLAIGAEVNNSVWSGRYPTLALAASDASTATVGVLLKHGGQMKQNLALQLAVRAEREDMIAYLRAHVADMNETPENDGVVGVLAEGKLGTPLHYAAEAREMRAVKFLLEKGADAKLTDGKWRTVWRGRGTREGSCGWSWLKC